MNDIVGNQALWSVIIGLVVAHVTSLAKKPSWTQTQKTALFAAVSAVFATIQLVAIGDIALDKTTLANLGEVFTTVVASATLFYNAWFKGTDLNKKLENSGNTD